MSGSGDYISREAAISASWKALYEYEDEMEKRFMEDPELDISDWFFHRIHVQMFHARLLDVLTNLPAADVRPKWISVEEKLPDDGAEVLAWSKSGFAYVDWWIDGAWKVNSLVDGKYEFVTHWMPLPEPPKEDKP